MENNQINSEEQKRGQIAARLKEARIFAGLSQAQAADRVGLKRPAISEIEAARRKVTAEEIIQFADLYKVDTSWLLLRDDENEGKMSEQLRLAARALSKLSDDDKEKLLHVLKRLPK